MFLILALSGEWRASALPKPMVDPPPTDTQQSTLSSFARASASCVTLMGVCIVAFE
jgi:hypothetical protein